MFAIGSSIDTYKWSNNRFVMFIIISSFLSYIISFPMIYPIPISETYRKIVNFINKKWLMMACF